MKLVQELDATGSVFVKFFLPFQKVVATHRRVAKVCKRGDKPQRPLQGLFACARRGKAKRRTPHEKPGPQRGKPPGDIEDRILISDRFLARLPE